MEATEPPSTVLAYYDHLLKAEPTNVAIWKRRISVLRRLGSIDKAVEELNQLLDTFYTDLEGWLELADLYSSCNQYVPVVHAFSKSFIIFSGTPLHFRHSHMPFSLRHRTHSYSFSLPKQHTHPGISR